MRDTGAGMTPQVLARAFDPFFTTKPFGAGSGLGLSTVFGFIRQSDGQVVIDSQEGVGTVVRLELPASCSRKPARHRKSPGVPQAGLQRAGRVLVVEDDDILRATTTDMVESLGYEAVPAASAEAALHQLKARRFDILFSDIVFTSGRDGWALATEARRRQADLAVLLCTGYGNKTVEMPDVLVLPKPYSRADLARLLDAAVSRAAQPDTASTSPANV